MAIGRTNAQGVQGSYIFKYTGQYSIDGQYKVTSSGLIIPKGNFTFYMLTSGTLTIKRAKNLDVHLVGGGGGGAHHGGGGGAGGYTQTYFNQEISNGDYSILIGAGGYGLDGRSYYYSPWDLTGGSSSAFGFSANGGGGAECYVSQWGDYKARGAGSGGSGGGDGGWTSRGTSGASNGGNSTGSGQGRNTYDFQDTSLTLRAGGGGGGSSASKSEASLPAYGGAGGGGDGGWSEWTARNGSINYGGGAGGGTGYDARTYGYGGNGGSGIVIIRNARGS